MKPSKYQQAVFDWIKNPVGNLIVRAVAGSGKTTTAVKSLEHIDPSQRVFFGTFTNTIADELKKRVPSHVTASTLSSFGYKMIRNAARGRFNVDKEKTEKILQWDVCNFKSLNQEQKREFYKSKGSIIKIVDLLKSQACGHEIDFGLVDELLDKHGVELPTLKNFDWKNMLERTWHLSLAEHYWIDFNDMLFYPILFDLEIEKFDWVFIDEAQDLNPVQIQLVSKMVKPDGHIVAIGDDYQAIYGFRGADVDAIEKLAATLQASFLPLSICYRCSKAVIREAQKVMPTIEAFDAAPEGSVSEITTKQFAPLDGDYALCRTTAPLVQNCLSLIRQGRRAKVLGKEIGTGLVALLETIGCNDNDDLTVFGEKVASYRSTNAGRLNALGKAAEAAAVNDRCDTLLALATRAENVRGIKAVIDEVFSDAGSDGVTFATIHKSKGLEAKNVYILCPDLLPHPAAKKDWQIKQETNLKYVGITRAQENLYWVSK